MKILVLSFYYEPDLSAGSFRATSFVKALQKKLAPHDSIEVVTTQPNRYHSYKIRAKGTEKNKNVSIKRIAIPLHKGTFVDQIRSFIVYFLQTLRFVMPRQYDIVFVTSGRSFSAFLGAMISRQKKIPLYLDIRDIFIDTMESIYKDSRLRLILPFFSPIERFTIKSASKINLISKGFIPYFQKKYGNDNKYSFFSNGIDDEFLYFDAYNFTETTDDNITFTYTGNIGEGQGLEKIVPQIAIKYRNIKFNIIGDGGRKKNLVDSIKNLENVTIIDPVNREELIKYYEKSNVLFLQLNNYEAFKKVLPSKIFEYAATYKPIIAGVDGYAREFIQEHLPDSLIFQPCDIDDFSRKYQHFHGIVDIDRRKSFIARFSRDTIMDQMSKDFLQILEVTE
jgi:glycosyltransferase involved in cell wall biosynthesis